MWMGVLLRVLSLIFLALQAALLDWYLIEYSKNKAAYGWIVADICVLVLYVVSYLFADYYFQQNHYEKRQVPPRAHGTSTRRKRHHKRKNAKTDQTNGTSAQPEVELEALSTSIESDAEDIWRQNSSLDWDEEEDHRVRNLDVGTIRKKYKLGSLPLAYLSWFFYATILAAKMVVIFLTFGEDLNTNALFGSNMLELAFASTAVVFALVVSSHKKVPKKTHQKPVIRWMQNHVMLDMLDSVEMLEFLYENSAESHKKIPESVKSAILAFVTIQLLLPSVGLYQLSATNFAHQNPPAYWSVLQQFLGMIFGNIPFLVIRIYLFTKHQFTESSFIFIIKNVYGILTNLWELHHWLLVVWNSRKEGKIAVPVACEDD